MSFIDWLTSNAPSQPTAPWGWCHIATLCLCLAVIVVLARTLRNKSQKAKNITLYILVGLLLVFEIARRVINLCTTTDRSAHNILYILAFRPWCAISSFVLMISIFIKKDWFYNFASTSGLLCTIIFFAYPGVGFRQNYLVFEDIYSIATHSIILILSLTLITLKFTYFDTKSLWKTLLCFVAVFAYAFLEIYALNIATDPLYFMPNGDIQEILGISYGLYLTIYLLFLSAFLSSFYFCNKRAQSKSKKAQLVQQDEPDDELSISQNSI